MLQMISDNNRGDGGKDLITMDFAVFSIAFNLRKLPAKGKNTPQNRLKSSLFSEILVFVAIVYAKYEFSLRQEYFYSENLKLAA
jgi:hypothetical protein